MRGVLSLHEFLHSMILEKTSMFLGGENFLYSHNFIMFYMRGVPVLKSFSVLELGKSWFF